MFDIELDEGGPTMRKLKLPYNKHSQLCVCVCVCVIHVTTCTCIYTCTCVHVY